MNRRPFCRLVCAGRLDHLHVHLCTILLHYDMGRHKYIWACAMDMDALHLCSDMVRHKYSQRLLVTLWHTVWVMRNSPNLWLRAFSPSGFKRRGRSDSDDRYKFQVSIGQLQWCTSRNKSGVLAAIRRFPRLAGPGFHLTGTLPIWSMHYLAFICSLLIRLANDHRRVRT